MSYLDSEMEKPIVTLTDVIEYTFCPRFIYYMHCLNIPQHGEVLYKVRKGREVHKVRAMTNREYLRHKINVMKKENEVFLASSKFRIKGKIDEILFLLNGTAAPLEYKFAEFKQKIWTTHAFQIILQALLIKENYNIEVNSGFVCYTRSNNFVKKIDISKKDYDRALTVIDNILEVIDLGYYPDKGRPKKRCPDCCYRNLCE